MTEFNELANTPVEMPLGGKTYKVRRVSLDTIFGKAEAAVLAVQMKRIREMAEGLDSDEKTTFLAKSMLESMPQGRRLSLLCADFLTSTDGVKMVLYEALRKDQPGVERELNLADLVSASKDEVSAIMAFVLPRRKEGAPESRSPLGVA